MGGIDSDVPFEHRESVFKIEGKSGQFGDIEGERARPVAEIRVYGFTFERTVLVAHESLHSHSAPYIIRNDQGPVISDIVFHLFWSQILEVEDIGATGFGLARDGYASRVHLFLVEVTVVISFSQVFSLLASSITSIITVV